MCHSSTRPVKVLLHAAPYGFPTYWLKWENEDTEKNRASRWKNPEFLNHRVKSHLLNTVAELLCKQVIVPYYVKHYILRVVT